MIYEQLLIAVADYVLFQKDGNRLLVHLNVGIDWIFVHQDTHLKDLAKKVHFQFQVSKIGYLQAVRCH